ncbi:MliC family protein [Geminicoccus flavidas]|uniref:MliC family protein n=1 Tax=Geminicoccus flavidas TaxID=2506407 RepID=UPI00135C1DA4|nr:MliC family protein [Geminicoccus flavidas]
MIGREAATAPVAGLLLATALLAGCQGRIEGVDRHVPPSGTTLAYGCDDGSGLQVTFTGLEAATIDHAGASRELHGVFSEQGAKYKAGDTILRIEGDQAILENVDGTSHCTRRG